MLTVGFGWNLSLLTKNSSGCNTYFLCVRSFVLSTQRVESLPCKNSFWSSLQLIKLHTLLIITSLLKAPTSSVLLIQSFFPAPCLTWDVVVGWLRHTVGHSFLTPKFSLALFCIEGGVSSRSQGVTALWSSAFADLGPAGPHGDHQHEHARRPAGPG